MVGGSLFIVESKFFEYFKKYFLGYTEMQLGVEVKVKGKIPEGKVNKFLTELTSCYQCSGSHVGWVFALFILVFSTSVPFWMGLSLCFMSAFAGGYISMLGVALLNYLDGAKSNQKV